MSKQSLADIVHDANDRLGDCRGAIEVAIESMLTSSDPVHAQACAIGALTLAVKEIKRIQEELDNASTKAGRAQALKLLPTRVAEVGNA